MKNKIKWIIMLSCCCLVAFIGGAVGMVACDNDSSSDVGGDQHWTSNY